MRLSTILDKISEDMILSRNLNGMIKTCQVPVRNYMRKKDGIC